MALVLFLQKEPFQPEQPQIIDDHLTPESKFTFVDFVPSVIKRSTTSVITTAEIEYHNFRIMVETANIWLQKNTSWEVINCETILLLYKYNDRGGYYELKPNDSTFYIYGSEKNNILRALRLWIKRRDINENIDTTTVSQVIDYYDVIPHFKDDNDYGSSKLENLDDVLDRVNTLIQESVIDGKIVTIETLQCEAGIDWKIDPDVTSSSFSSKNLFILRIFFEQGFSCKEEIGIVDFVPRHISGGGFFRKPKFENYSEVMSRATRWLSENPDINFKNAQSVDIKLKSLNTVDTKTLAFTEHGDYVRIFRIAYSKPMFKDVLDGEQSKQNPIYLASKWFMASRKHDTIKDINQKLEEWVDQVYKEYSMMDVEECNKPKLLSAETVEVFCKTDDTERERAVDDTFQYNRFGTKNGYLFMTFRVYFDIGLYGYNKVFENNDTDKTMKPIEKIGLSMNKCTNSNTFTCNLM